MTSLTRRALTAAAMAAGLLLAGGTATANADILDALADEYGRSASGGQVPNLVDDALNLRAQGARPTAGNIQAIQEALTKRPNLLPLAGALQATVAQQQQMLARGGGGTGAVPGGGTRATPWVPDTGDDNNPLIPGGWGGGINPFS
ncbi:hypothetical protein [Mycolicibacterium bacteremicum]|uniref:hypothetical protein n=1 Tax=Mycolicibacterium bacteremicum TaxID=564198 RepID=UPI0026EBEB6B|nr:hypothetical protein [Mycolicibacterium bacteremicum]